MDANELRQSGKRLMKVLLLGCNGQVGWELQRALAPLGDLVALSREGRNGLCGDLNRLDALAQTVRTVQPDIIVNAAAYTAVDRAESEPESALRINADAPAVLAEEACKTGAWLVHYSTDYVFDGGGNRPWRETDTTAPLSVYGATKLQGEEAIRRSDCRHLIFRTSWIYSVHGNNFVKTMLRLARERDRLEVVDDQVGAPTGAELLADVTAHAIRCVIDRPETAGLYHLTATGEVSWHGYAQFIIEFARGAGAEIKIAPDGVVPVSTSAFPASACRPLNSRLDTGKFCDTFHLRLPGWQAGVARMLAEVLECP